MNLVIIILEDVVHVLIVESVVDAGI
jgi:hypothetical protein